MKPSATSLFKISVIAAAAVAAAVRVPATVVERAYAARLYPFIQSNLTFASNQSPVALFDVAIVAVAVAWVGGWWWSVRRARKARSLWPVLRGLGTTVSAIAAVYLWFLAAWGFNYARPPLESLLRFDPSRVTPAAVRALAERAVGGGQRTPGPPPPARVPARHPVAPPRGGGGGRGGRPPNPPPPPPPAAGFPALNEVPAALVESLHEVERRLGRPRATVPSLPKPTLLSPFFRASGVSGMLAPFFLETLVNPDLTGPERPMVLAHEWAHVAGYAPESDASYVGLLAALAADPASQYSAWLELTFEAANQLQPVTRGLVLAALGPGPRADQAAINQRLQAMVRPVEQAAWVTYDRLLKSQGVEEGVRSYSRVIELVLGTNALMLEP